MEREDKEKRCKPLNLSLRTDRTKRGNTEANIPAIESAIERRTQESEPLVLFHVLHTAAPTLYRKLHRKEKYKHASLASLFSSFLFFIFIFLPQA